MISADLLGNVVAWSLQAAVVFGAACVLPWLLRVDAAGVRYAYWRAVALLCLALPLIQPYQGMPRVRSTSAIAIVDTIAVSAVSSTPAARSVDWAAVAVAVVAAGAVMRLLWLGFGLVRLRRSVCQRQ